MFSLYWVKHYCSKFFKMIPGPALKLLMTGWCRIEEIILPYTWPSGRELGWKLYLSKEASRISLKGKYLKTTQFPSFYSHFYFTILIREIKLQWLVSSVHHHLLQRPKRQKMIDSGESRLFLGIDWQIPAQIHVPRKPGLFAHHSAKNVCRV